MANVPRVRFAPSPTGYFHVGGARTALYNWLFVRRLGGVFVLRIEDTDRERSDESWTEGITSGLSWLGIDWDEGPYLQSERRELYDAAIEKLVRNGSVYACDCTRQEIEARTRGKTTPGYDGYCRDRNLTPGLGLALRFRSPDEGTTVVHDIVRGDVSFANSTIEDFVVVKSNGDPLFVLAVVVDDMDMRITHVIRAEEHLPTTPKAILLWEALGGGDLPFFAHLPVLVNAQRQKLSKRKDRVAVEDYRALGYLPEALRNYLALLGWSPSGEEEILTIDELIAMFRLEDVIRSPAFFDEKRLDHFNGVYIRALTEGDFLLRATPFLDADDPNWLHGPFNEDALRTLAPLVQERVTKLGDVVDMLGFAYREPFVVEPGSFAKVIERDATALGILKAAREQFSKCSWDATTIREIVTKLGEEVGWKLGKAQAPVRVAAMGKSVGLPLFESLEVLGRERTINRLDDALTSAT